MKKPIKIAVCNLYDDIALSEEELKDIQQRLEQPDTTSKQAKNIQTNRLIAIACTLILSLSIGFFSLMLNFSSSKTERIVNDVVDNHLLHKTLQYNDNSLVALSSKFSYLGFILSAPTLTDTDTQLIGARPCFILGIPAAQLRYQRKHKERWTTVFQTRYQKSIYGPIPDIHNAQQPLIKTERGVRVSLWRENGLLFAVAQMH